MPYIIGILIGFILAMMALNPIVDDTQQELVALKAHYAKMECIEVVEYGVGK